MAQPFKKQIVRYYTPDGQRCGPGQPGAVKHVEESKKYYGLVPQPNGKRKPVPLCPDLGRSKQLLNKLLADAAFRQHGMADPYEPHRKRPLADHLADFRAALSAKGNSPDYIALVLGRLVALTDGCGWQTLGDVSASQADEWLAGQRTSGRPASVLSVDQVAFTPGETAKLLGGRCPRYCEAPPTTGNWSGKGPAIPQGNRPCLAGPARARYWCPDTQLLPRAPAGIRQLASTGSPAW
jgi:hypothetical protein